MFDCVTGVQIPESFGCIMADGKNQFISQFKLIIFIKSFYFHFRNGNEN
jgi:hypothetical protein